MHLDSHAPPRDPKAQLAADRRRLGRALRLAIGFVAALAVTYGVQGMIDWRAFTVQPGSLQGLAGVLTAPLLHGSPGHLIANGASLLVLGTLALAVYPRATLRALPLMWLGSGLFAWWLGDAGSRHLGASGLSHGLMFLVFALGLLRRDRAAIAAAMIAFFFHGGMLLTVLPQEPGVSWQAHLGGAIGGLLGALLFRSLDPKPPRKRYSWELEEEAAPVPAANDEAGMLEPPGPDAVPVLWRRAAEQRGVVLQFPDRRSPERRRDGEGG